jgi:diacylglycerol kinase (ATP)
MTRRFVAIHNPISGRGNARAKLARIREVLHARGAQLEVIDTKCAGHAGEIAATLDADVEAVLVAGGDGTTCEVVNGLGERALPMVLLGKGTENLLARQMNMPSAPDEVAAALLDGQVVTRDAGMINGRLFLSVAGIGFDAECVHRLYAVRRCNITHVHYFWPIWRTFWEHRFPELRVQIDGEMVFNGCGLIVLGMMDRYSIGFRVLPEARANDGLLDVSIFPCASRWELVAHAARVAMVRHVGRAGVVYRQCRSVTVQSPERVPIETDGDPGGVLPADCSVLAQRARFLMPKARRGD